MEGFVGSEHHLNVLFHLSSSTRCKNVAPEGPSDGRLRLAGGSAGRTPFRCAGEAILTCSGDTVQKPIKPRPAGVLAWLPYQLKPGDEAVSAGGSPSFPDREQFFLKFNSSRNNFEELHQVLKGTSRGNERSLLSEVSPEGGRGTQGQAADTLGWRDGKGTGGYKGHW